MISVQLCYDIDCLHALNIRIIHFQYLNLDQAFTICKRNAVCELFYSEQLQPQSIHNILFHVRWFLFHIIILLIFLFQTSPPKDKLAACLNEGQVWAEILTREAFEYLEQAFLVGIYFFESFQSNGNLAAEFRMLYLSQD